MLDPEKLTARTESREEIFTRRYQKLLNWALRLTNQHHALAEDLVQDAFIQFTRGRTSLEQIENVDGYLHRMLKNMNLSRLSRCAEQLQEKHISIAERELLQLDSHDSELTQRLQTQEQLQRICQYACSRKETSRAGSVLILKFVFEYTPAEIAQVLCCSRHCVDQWQRFARREVKLYLADPQRLKFVNAEPPLSLPTIRLFNVRNPLPDQLRQVVQSARRGECMKTDELEDIYRSQREDTLTSARLGHIVSCSGCLDEVNRIVGLPSLSERYKSGPTDSQLPPNSGGRAGGSSEGPTDLSTRFRQRLEEVVQHKPNELHISVNSTPVGSILVNGDNTELIINISPDDQIDFVEIRSEEDLPLLFFSLGLAEQTTDETDHWAQIELSEGRILAAYLCVDNGRQTLRLSYTVPPTAELVCVPTTHKLSIAELPRTVWSGFIPAPLAQLIGTLRTNGGWLKPALATLSIALLALAAAFLFKAPPTGNAVLDEARLIEDNQVLDDKYVTYQVVRLEELDQAGDVVTERRIEVWHDVLKNRHTRLLFGDSQLLAGKWESDGYRTVYHHGSLPIREQIGAAPESPLDLDPWLLDVTTKQFQSIIGPALDATQILDSASIYIIRWDGNHSKRSLGNSMLLSATLTLAKKDLHAVAQSLKLERAGEVHQYRFTEEDSERFKGSDISPEVFDPQALKVSTTNDNLKQPTQTEVRTTSSIPLYPNVASTELEIEVAYLLDRAKGDRSEQISLTRMADGSLQIAGVVDTKERRDELLRSLSPLKTNPLVKIDLQTPPVHIPAQRGGLQGRIIETFPENTPDQIPVDQDLRKYLSKSGKSSDVDQAIRDFSSQALNHAYRALFQAIELKRLTSRFANTDLRKVAPEARAQWLRLIREHADALVHETEILRRQLKPVFFGSALQASIADRDKINNDRELQQAIEKLHRLALINNETIRGAFTISSKSSGTEVKSDEFWRTLLDAQELAARIRAYND